ncbi:YdeI/OmpD-associated family protein [Fimbriimonas ginsengisoli]|uniref:Bacteriocin-protection protein n=1 Tax=Fimbriimonas ginsengisoli Gsoil 348 TaxID=661478 RepID=A0A068NPB4_FIMGI|nr:YdeI/OmpD-associated family protein [Fimbriimonas ginsengisoli]AIE83429.1 hypothetical protein OP10G_0061 [Fimbriimonas ginsengisoli Gsoil 348]
MEPVYFESPLQFRSWLEQNHEVEDELLVGFYKTGTGIPSMTWPESVDEALSFGWIDAIRRRVDDERYTIRFVRRRPKSSWSAVNLRRMKVLIEEGRVRPAGLKIYEERIESKTYSYEGRPHDFPDELRERFQAHPKAWEFFQSQPPTYRRHAIWWVTSPKREETKEKRFKELIESSEKGERHPYFINPYIQKK